MSYQGASDLLRSINEYDTTNYNACVNQLQNQQQLSLLGAY